MGNRISIQFGQHYTDESIWLSAVLCHHWGGRYFVNEAVDFINSLIIDRKHDKISGPLTRLDPDAIMVAFVQNLPKSDSLRLVPTKDDCDNSDNGHFILWLDNREVKGVKVEKID
jgi:hypothetical protein